MPIARSFSIYIHHENSYQKKKKIYELNLMLDKVLTLLYMIFVVMTNQQKNFFSQVHDNRDCKICVLNIKLGEGMGALQLLIIPII